MGERKSLHTELELIVTVYTIVWKFQNFSATQILREIICSHFRVSKTAIFAVSEALKLGFGQFWPPKNAEIH